MSLNWQWSDKMGEVIFEDDCYKPEHPYRTNIYEGNCLMIWCNEFNFTGDGEFEYSMYTFAADMEHFKNCLGLNAKKGYGKENNYNHYRIKRLRLNTRYKSVPKIVEAFAKAKTNITIELYYEEETK